MASKLRPKHQRLVKQCYPAGRGVDKRANASELSYLLYYASTRRIKLAKVGHYLQEKTKSDVYKSRVGNVQVGLEICDNLITRCHEDLSVFSENVVSILSAVLASRDLGLCENTNKVFESLCHYHDNSLLSGDPDYVVKFNGLIRQYMDIGMASHTGLDSLKWTLIGIRAVKSLTASQVLLSSPVDGNISDIVNLLLSNLSLDEDGTSIIVLKQQISNQAASNTDSTELLDGINEQDREKKELLLSTAQALKQLVDKSSAPPIYLSASRIVSFIIEKKTPLLWANVLLATVAEWAPVQLRFAIMMALVDKLASLKTSSLEDQYEVTCLICSLLSGPVNMIGLSVIDVLGSLVNHQNLLIRFKLATPNKEKRDISQAVDRLLLGIRDCIGALTTHIYYADQIGDIVINILSRGHMSRAYFTSNESISSRLPSTVPSSNTSQIVSRTEPSQGNDSSGTDNHVVNGASSGELLVSETTESIIVNYLLDVERVLKLVYSGSKQTDVNPIPLSSWSGSSTLMTYENPEIRSSFIHAFLTYLELTQEQTHDHSLSVSDHSPSENTLRSIIQSSLFFGLNEKCDSEGFLQLYLFNERLIRVYGTEAIRFIIPYLYLFQDIAKDNESSSLQTVSLMRVVLELFAVIAEEIKSGTLIDIVGSKIDQRKASGTWPELNKSSEAVSKEGQDKVDPSTFVSPQEFSSGLSDKNETLKGLVSLTEAFGENASRNDTVRVASHVGSFASLGGKIGSATPVPAPASSGVGDTLHIAKARSFRQLQSNGPRAPTDSSDVSLYRFALNSALAGDQESSNGEKQGSLRREASPSVGDLKRVVSNGTSILQQSITTSSESMNSMAGDKTGPGIKSLWSRNGTSIAKDKSKGFSDMKHFLDSIQFDSGADRGNVSK